MRMVSQGRLPGPIPSPLPAELFETLATGNGVTIERIVSRANVSPEGFWFDQNDDEWVMLQTGAARIQFDDREVSLEAGDWLHIPAHVRHRVTYTSDPAAWLAVHFHPLTTDE